MIDIHSHIVFDVDDGPKTIEDSRALLEESYRQGVRTIISTSHRRKGMFETPEAKIEENFKVLSLAAAHDVSFPVGRRWVCTGNHRRAEALLQD